MSASLVGSEMCIRDRKAEMAKLGTGPPACPQPGASKNLQVRGPGGEPVSYTHLTLPTICSV
eukprot:10197434-Alexandrium_andersonii.AAC.1